MWWIDPFMEIWMWEIHGNSGRSTKQLSESLGYVLCHPLPYLKADFPLLDHLDLEVFVTHRYKMYEEKLKTSMMY